MGAEDNGDMELQHTGGEGLLNCPPSDKVAGMAMGSRSMFRSSSAADPFYASGWEPLVSLSHTEDFGGSSMVAPNEFVNPSYPVVLENQIINTAPHLVRYPPVSGIVADMVPKLPCFGSGSFSEMVGAFGLPECGQIANTGCPPNYPSVMEGATEKTSTNAAYSQEDCQNSDEGGMGASPKGKGKGKKRASETTHSPLNPNKNVEGEQQKDLSGDSSESPTEQGEKKRKIEQSTNANFRGKQAGKQTKDNSNNGEVPKENYIHVRARRGQATNSHSLAERVRRERISERMRLLQELVPGCNKVTGKAVMLDEIINYVQSLQQQVEFLSMKLATVNPELNIDIERILSKDILHSQGGGAPVIGFCPGMSSSHPYSQGIQPGTLAGIPNTNPPFHPLPQNLWDNELQSLLQMGFDSNPANNNLGPSGIPTLEL